jgi:Domain of unknown function DUF29
MATKLQERAAKLYKADFYAWAEEQAARLRARQFERLDLDNLIEEVEGLADTKLSAVLNSARVVMEHLLKLEHSPATDPRNSWRASVREHRRRVQTDLTPRIGEILRDPLPRFYAMAREDAAAGMRDHGEDAAADALPTTCPYMLDQVTGDWWPDVATPSTDRPVF